jgi:hypothetical protein
VSKAALLCAALGILAAPWSPACAANPEPGSYSAGAAVPDACSLLKNESGVPVVHLDAAGIDSVASGISDRNLALIERIDAAYRAGHYGDPSSATAREDALAAFIYGAMTAFDFVVGLASQTEAIYTTSEADLKEAFTKRLRNPGFYPVINLVEARMGFGKFCLHFAVAQEGKREIVVGGEKTRAWPEDLKFSDRKVRVLNVEMNTFSHDDVHIIYEELSGGEYEVVEAEIEGTPVEIVFINDIEGMFIRKWGFHQSGGVAIWKSLSHGLDPPPRGQRYLGAAAYFPALELELPWFLPDIGLNDLRKFDYPEPLLTLDAVHELQERNLDWLQIQGNLRFSNWEGQGTIPELVVERFPDQ